MEKTASTPIQLFRGMTADELAALRAAHDAHAAAGRPFDRVGQGNSGGKLATARSI